MGKQIYKKIYNREVTITDGRVLVYKGLSNTLYYGEPDENKREITDWDELLKELYDNVNDEFKGQIDKKNRIWCNLDCGNNFEFTRDWFKLYKDEFVSAKIYYTFDILNPKNLRVKELVEKLNVEDYISFLKDNGINYIAGL